MTSQCQRFRGWAVVSTSGLREQGFTLKQENMCVVMCERWTWLVFLIPSHMDDSERHIQLIPKEVPTTDTCGETLSYFLSIPRWDASPFVCQPMSSRASFLPCAQHVLDSCLTSYMLCAHVFFNQPSCPLSLRLTFQESCC